MKIYLYYEKSKKSNDDLLNKHINFLEQNNIEYTFDKRDNFDLIHVVTFKPKDYKFLKEPKLAGKPIIFSEIKELDGSKFDIKSLKLADYIIVSSHFSNSKIGALKDINCTIKTIYSDFDITNFKNRKSNKELFQNEMKFSPLKQVILVPGIKKNNHELKYLLSMTKEFPHLTFVLDTKYKSNKLPKNIVLKDIDDEELLISALEFSNCLFVSTREEIDETIILKALALKIPILISDSLPYKGWLKNNYDCLKGYHFIDYLKNLDSIMLQENKLILENGYKTASRYSKDISKEQLKEIYLSLLKR